MSLETVKSIVGTLGAVLAVVSIISASIIVIISNWSKTKVKDRSDALEDESNTVHLMSARIDALEGQVKELTSKLAMQDTVIAEKDKHIKLQADQIQMMERIFQNRNPELESFMKNSTERMEILIAASTKGNQCLELLVKQLKIKSK